MNRAQRTSKTNHKVQKPQKLQQKQQKRKLATKAKITKPLKNQLRRFSADATNTPAEGIPESFDVEAVDFNEQPDADAFQQKKPFAAKKYDEPPAKGFIKQDNPSSFHAPVFAARPLKVNINNIFDPRANYSLEHGYYTLKFEVGHDGQNIEEDMMEKSDWHDTHITNEWFDTMMTRYCPHISKKAKQMKPSNARQSRHRKLWKQTKEKRLATAIRDAVDNTPRFATFSNALAENKQLYGTYLPGTEHYQAYRKSGKGVEAKLANRGREVDYKHKLLRKFRNDI